MEEILTKFIISQIRTYKYSVRKDKCLEGILTKVITARGIVIYINNLSLFNSTIRCTIRKLNGNLNNSNLNKSNDNLNNITYKCQAFWRDIEKLNRDKVISHIIY